MKHCSADGSAFLARNPGLLQALEWTTEVRGARLTSVLWHQDQFWKDIAPFMLPTGATVVLALMGLPIIAYRQRKADVLGCVVPAHSDPCIHRNHESPRRIHIGLFSLRAHVSRSAIHCGVTHLRPRFGAEAPAVGARWWAEGFVALFVGRQIILRPRIEQAARASEVVTPWERAKLTEECTSEYALAHLYGQIAVGDLSERIHAYACQALHYGEHETLYPSYSSDERGVCTKRVGLHAAQRCSPIQETLFATNVILS